MCSVRGRSNLYLICMFICVYRENTLLGNAVVQTQSSTQTIIRYTGLIGLGGLELAGLVYHASLHKIGITSNNNNTTLRVI